MSGSVGIAGDRLRSFVERIERLEVADRVPVVGDLLLRIDVVSRFAGSAASRGDRSGAPSSPQSILPKEVGPSIREWQSWCQVYCSLMRYTC